MTELQTIDRKILLSWVRVETAVYDTDLAKAKIEAFVFEVKFSEPAIAWIQSTLMVPGKVVAYGRWSLGSLEKTDLENADRAWRNLGARENGRAGVSP